MKCGASDRRAANTERTGGRSLQRRLQEASREIENYSQYDYILVNEKVEPAIDVLQAIVKAERLKRSPQGPRGAEDEHVLATAEMAERGT